MTEVIEMLIAERDEFALEVTQVRSETAQQILKMQEHCRIYVSALECIAVGDSDDPRAESREALIEGGTWSEDDND